MTFLTALTLRRFKTAGFQKNVTAGFEPGAWLSIVWGQTSLETSDKSWESGGAEKVSVGKKMRRPSDAKTFGQLTILHVSIFPKTLVFCLLLSIFLTIRTSLISFFRLQENKKED